jgi:multidrug efflux system membrane fusion protein
MSRAKSIVFLLAIGFGVFIGYRLFVLYQKVHAPRPLPPIVVSTATVQSQRLPRYLPAIGTIKAAQEVILTTEAEGRISKIFFTSGKDVRQGELLLQLADDVEQADLKRYEAAFRLAAVNLQRASSLASKNVESRATLDQRRAEFQQAEAQVLQTKALINRKQVRAPFSGKLGIGQVDLGQYVQPGTKIVTLTDLSQLRVNFSRPEQDWPLLAIGQTVIVTVDAYPGQQFKGTITSIDPQLQEETRTIDVQATLLNPEHQLIPGMFATVKVELPVQKEALIIPETAIDYSLYGTSTFVVRQQKDEKTGQTVWIAERREIEIGSYHRGLVEVSKGLQHGEQVVSAGHAKLENGMPVVINNTIHLEPRHGYTY